MKKQKIKLPAEDRLGNSKVNIIEESTAEKIFIISPVAWASDWAWPAHTPSSQGKRYRLFKLWSLTPRWDFPFSRSTKHCLILIVLVLLQACGAGLNCRPQPTGLRRIVWGATGARPEPTQDDIHRWWVSTGAQGEGQWHHTHPAQREDVR